RETELHLRFVALLRGAEHLLRLGAPPADETPGEVGAEHRVERIELDRATEVRERELLARREEVRVAARPVRLRVAVPAFDRRVEIGERLLRIVSVQRVLVA